MRGLRLPVTFYLVLVFLSGVGVGVLADNVYRTRVVRADRHSRSSEEYRKKYISEMERRLNLASGQVKQLEQILDETRIRYREMRDRLRPELKVIQEKQTTKIQAILNPEQRAEYEKMREEREKLRQGKSR